MYPSVKIPVNIFQFPEYYCCRWVPILVGIPLLVVSQVLEVKVYLLCAICLNDNNSRLCDGCGKYAINEGRG